MTPAEPKKRSPGAAAALNVICLGLGFVYLGRPRWALATLLAPLAALGIFAWTRSIFLPPGFAAFALTALVVWLTSIVLAVRIADSGQAAAPLARYQRWYVYVGYFLLTAIAFNALLQSRGALFGYETFRIPSGAMEDTLKRGDYFMSDTWRFQRREPERGEVVVFLFPGDRSLTYVKRVIGVPGDTVLIRAGEVRVNGLVLNEPYVAPANNRGLNVPTGGEVRVPPGQYYVLGDNRDDSSDSRNWGFVPRENLYGSVEYIWYSRDLARVGLRPR